MNSSSANILKILNRQFISLLKKSPEGVHPIYNEEDPLDIQCDILGPVSTPYEGGVFRVKLEISNDFPQAPPKGICLTKIYHPNISERGDICVNILKKDWNPNSWSLYNIFEIIKCLLIVPFPQSALNEDAGKMFMDDYNEYVKIAKIYTNIYARPKKESSNDFIQSSAKKVKVRCVNYIKNEIGIGSAINEGRDHRMILANIMSMNNSLQSPKVQTTQDQIKKWLNRL